MKYRKKPIIVDAFQWTGDQDQVVDPEWICDAIMDGDVVFENFLTENVRMIIHTLEGVHRGKPGDYIIRGIQGELYPCRPDIFEATYEKVEEE
jgi:hypothetical protein